MLTIIAHHYVVNSTVQSLYDYQNPPIQQYFLEGWGMWGKTAINSFILISGYFMCQMKLTWQRFFKLLIQIYFYGIVIMLIFALTGYQPLTFKIVIKKIFGMFMHINNGFTASFMVFYAFVPIYNKVINNINKKTFRNLLLGLIFIFTICSSFFRAGTMNEPCWYMCLYFIAAYIRLYPNPKFKSLKLWSWILIISFILSVSSVYSIAYLGRLLNIEKICKASYFLVSDSNKILAFIVGLSAFMVAKNLPEFKNKFLNLAAAGTFAVLLIHASSDTMRKWLWQDICNVPSMINADMSVLILHALTIPLIIFSICSFIDYFYRKWIERPITDFLYTSNKFSKTLNKVFEN